MLPTKVLLAILPALASTAAACKGPPANDNALNLIKEFEGSRPTPYDDGSGYMTIGVGHRCEKDDCSDVPYPQPLNDDSITKLLREDVVVSPSPFSFLFFSVLYYISSAHGLLTNPVNRAPKTP